MNKIKSKKKVLVIIVIIIVFIICYFNFSNNHYYIGEVEGVMVSHSSEVSGKIIKCPIELGSEIKKGDIVAIIDNTNQKYVVEQLSLKLQKAELAVKSSKVGKGGIADHNYSLAKANYESAVVIADKAEKDYNKSKKLFEEAAISEDALNGAKLAYETAIKSVEVAKSKVNNISDKTAGNTADIEVEILKSQLNQQKEILEKHNIVATCNGIVMSKNYREGDLVAPGYDISDISSTKEKYVVIYYPESKLNDIKYNQKVDVILGEESVEGKIMFIDIKAQYTPKEMQSAANRNQESIRVKILIPEKCDVNIGQKIKVSL